MNAWMLEEKAYRWSLRDSGQTRPTESLEQQHQMDEVGHLQVFFCHGKRAKRVGGRLSGQPIDSTREISA